MRGVLSTLILLIQLIGSLAFSAGRWVLRSRFACWLWSVRWLAPLVGFFALVGLVDRLLRLHTFQPNDSWDVWILGLIAVTYLLCAGITLLWTRLWTMRGLGLVGTILGDLFLYGGSVLSHAHYVTLNQSFLTFIRACFITGGTFLLISIIIWVRDQVGIRREARHDQVRAELLARLDAEGRLL